MVFSTGMVFIMSVLSNGMFAVLCTTSVVAFKTYHSCYWRKCATTFTGCCPKYCATE